MEVVFYIIILSVVGFANAYFLHWQYLRFKKTKKPMFCLIGEDCAGVIDSRYGATLGVKNEITGMFFYTAISVLLVLSLFFPPILPIASFIILLASLAAAVFSLYLLYVQAAVLKKLCSWCLISIFLNVIIFVFAVKLVI
ncbi:hypothetical protein IID22_04475 [Patescibacteria group bacterium]|nr:hypothetical protein [Patescibacteria group bacterium]